MSDQEDSSSRPAPYVVPSTRGRDLAIGVGAGVAIVLLIILALSYMGNRVTGNLLYGTIKEKRFIPVVEEQVTIGKGGIHATRTDGEYIFDVDVKGRLYNVWVDKTTYEANKVGDVYPFPNPNQGD